MKQKLFNRQTPLQKDAPCEYRLLASPYVVMVVIKWQPVCCHQELKARVTGHFIICAQSS